MSLVLSSNQIATRNLGSYKSLVSNATDELAAYKARVLADGGTVIDEAATKAAIQKLIDKGVYGLAKVYVGGSFGVKKDGSGNLIKLYSIDGLDMTLFSIGVGKPVNHIAGEIVFTNDIKSSTTQTDGTVFTTELTQAPKGRGLVYGISGSSIKNAGSAEAGVSGFTLLDKQTNSSPLWFVTIPTGGGTVNCFKQTGIPDQNSTANTTRVQANVSTTGTRYSFFSDYINNQLKGYRDGGQVTAASASSAIADLTGFNGYITLGGYIKKTTVTESFLSNIKVKEFFVFDDLPESRLYLA
ncbi:hypothetical protein [Acinetobacter baumannii]|uniref:hypothetical protein n=1 Tax=Acinetobacter baumannii TaxID=470 RepID=UPI0002CF7CBF|nr:hypothetical protein [Acinetobacter baumannii]ENW41153.1 hypothetical protein F919_03689 [Acinetobacter baumannii NIPH 329]KRI30499.1 hypothetical protein APB98_11515 [Acinetobacter baumannii]HDX6158775.1 hypothetical protein [Acinetobacter baumannii]